MDSRLQEHLDEILRKRETIKNDYVKAWLAVNVPDEHLNADWVIKNVRLVENHTQSHDPFESKYTWYLELKQSLNQTLIDELDK